MAFKGNLRSFSLGNVFQMIFMEKKGGRLTVSYKTRSLCFFFDQGKVVHAKREDGNDERMLKLLMLRNRYITEEQWDSLIDECERNFQPIWISLYSHFAKNTENFFFLHQRHIERAMFDVLQWDRGDYAYDPEETPNLNQKIFRPLDGEFLLMEGYRAIDEWKKLESKLPSMDTKIATSPRDDEGPIETRAETDDNEKYVLAMLQQPGVLRDLIDSSQLAICDTGRAVEKLLSSGLLTVLTPREAPQTSTRGRVNWKRPALMGLILLSVFVGASIREKYLPGEFSADRFVDQYKAVQARRTMRRMAKALKYYTALKGKWPDSVPSLLKAGYLSAEEAVDPWGRQFFLEKNGQFLILFSQGPSVDDPGDDIYCDLEHAVHHD